jgi:Mg-chelatase subunit ChlD
MTESFLSAWPAHVLAGFSLAAGTVWLAAPAARPAMGTSQGTGEPYFAIERTLLPVTTGLVSPFRLSGDGSDTVVVLDIEQEGVATIDLSAGTSSWWFDEEPVPEGIDGGWQDWGAISVAGPLEGGFIVQRRLGRIVHHGDTHRRELLERVSAAGETVWQGPLPFNVPEDALSPSIDRFWIQDLALAGDGNMVFLLERGMPSIGAVDTTYGRNDHRAHFLPPASARKILYEFGWYVDIEEAPDGRIAVLDQVNSQVHLTRTPWSPDQRLASSTIDVAGRPMRFSINASGEIFVLDVDGSVRVYDRFGGPVADVGAHALSVGSRSSFGDILALDDGGFVLSDQLSGKLHVVSRQSDRHDGQAGVSSCLFDVDKKATPILVQVGEPVEIVLRTSGKCPARSGTDFVILMSFSDERDGTGAIAYARDFVNAVDFSADRVGIIGANYRSGATVVSELGSDRDVLITDFDELMAPPPSGAGIPNEVGYRTAQEEFESERGRTDAARVIVSFTSGWTLPGSIVRDTIYVKGRGTRVVALMDIEPEYWKRVQFNARDTAQLTLRYIASGWWDFHEAGKYDLDGAAELYRELSADGDPLRADVLAQSMVVTDTIPANMVYEVGSAVPPAVWDEDRRTLTWDQRNVPLAGAQLHYTVRPTDTGIWPTNVEARAALTDGLGVAQRLIYPVPTIEVIAPTREPTPRPSPTAAPSASPTATPADTPTPGPIHLPLALREACDATSVRIDVALAIDASSSMSEPAVPGGVQTKLEAAVAAVGTFLDILALDEGDQAAILSFSSDAWLHTGLSSVGPVLDAALTDVRLGRQTRLDRAVEEGADALRDPTLRRPANTPVLVLLTDGRANPVPVAEAVAKAGAAKAEGITIFTIGLGDDLETVALQAIASSPSYYFHAPDAADLAGIYERVASSIPCPARAYWGRR